MVGKNDFAGKNAIVTGGRRGIGRAVAEDLARGGAALAVVAQSPDGTELVESLNALGGRAYYLRANLAEPGERENLIARAETLLRGPVHILFNGAGTVVNGSICDLTRDAYVFSRELLLDATVDLMRQALPGMCERRRGWIVNVASVYGLRNAPGCFTYSVFKRAVIAATECAAKSVARYGVNVNCIAPGTVRTELTESRGDFIPERHAGMLREYPANRTGEVEDIAAAFRYLVSDDAAFVHGHTLVVDGGFLL